VSHRTASFLISSADVRVSRMPGAYSRTLFSKEVNSMLKYFVAPQAYIMNAVHNLRHSEEGQTMAEYGVVLAVITIGAVAVFGLLAGGITGAINAVIAKLPKP
jgi:Flp pilus assembly pilin Flp